MKRARQTKPHIIDIVHVTLFNSQDRSLTYTWEGTESQWKAYRAERGIKFDDIVSIKVTWEK